MFHTVFLYCLFLHGSQHIPPFQLSSQLFSASSMLFFHPLFLVFTNCSYILLFFYSSFFSLIQLSLNYFLFTASFYSIVSAAFTPSINNSTEFLKYYPKLLSSILMHPSKLINPLPPIFLLRHTLSTLLLEGSIPCIVTNFLVLLFKLSSSSVFHFQISAPYLITKTAQVSTAIILFLPFNFDLDLDVDGCHIHSLILGYNK